LVWSIVRVGCYHVSRVHIQRWYKNPNKCTIHTTYLVIYLLTYLVIYLLT